MADAERAMENLRKRGYSTSLFADRGAAARYLVDEIGGRPVGIGGSMTISQLDIYGKLRERGPVFWHWKSDAEETVAKANSAPVYLMSANGVSESGQIVNIDGNGNRVMNMCYGHEKVFIVIGINKLAPDDESAMWRARNIASPKNARRFRVDTPCVRGEERCYNCSGKSRICNVFVTLERKPRGIGEMELVIVEEALGY